MKTIIRTIIVMAIVGVALVLLMCEEQDESLLIWLLHFAIDKIGAFLLMAAGLALCNYWHLTDLITDEDE